MTKFRTALQGRKTYLLAAAAALSSLAAWADNSLSTFDLIKALFFAAGMITVRAGITTEAAKLKTED